MHTSPMHPRLAPEASTKTSPLAHHLILSFAQNRRALAPAPFDRAYRQVGDALCGIGPLALCLLPGRLEVVLLGAAAVIPGLCQRIFGALSRGQVPVTVGRVQRRRHVLALDDSQALQLAVASVENRAVRHCRLTDPLDWRWSTAWERAGLRHVVSAGAADLRALLPHGRPMEWPAPPPELPPMLRAPRSLDLVELRRIAALSAGVALADVGRPDARVARQRALQLALSCGLSPSQACIGLGLQAGIQAGDSVAPVLLAELSRPGPGLAAALRLYRAVLDGRVRLVSPKQPRPGRCGLTGPLPGARLARRLALGA